MIDQAGIGAPSTATVIKRKKFETLETGRGLAAIFVVIAHSATIIAQPRFYDRVIWNGGFGRFGAGVDFFFVLSGFIIAWAHWSDIGHPDRVANYAQRRFYRIYPPYWCVLVPLAAAYFLFPAAGTPSQHDPWNFAFSFALLPFPQEPVLGVAWTLVREIIFYVVFGLLILLGRRALWALFAWGGAIVIMNLAIPDLGFPAAILLDTANLEFLLGLGVAAYMRRNSVPVPGLLAALGFAVFATLILTPQIVIANPLAMRVAYGSAIALGIMGIAELERGRDFAVPAIFRQLGAGSYAIYLIHGIAISAMIQIVTRILPKSIPLGLVMVILVAAGLAVGMTYHWSVEKPLARFLKAQSSSRKTPLALTDRPRTG
jgi:exopolysaccharide production protein ExoZ